MSNSNNYSNLTRNQKLRLGKLEMTQCQWYCHDAVFTLFYQ